MCLLFEIIFVRLDVKSMFVPVIGVPVKIGTSANLSLFYFDGNFNRFHGVGNECSNMVFDIKSNLFDRIMKWTVNIRVNWWDSLVQSSRIESAHFCRDTARVLINIDNVFLSNCLRMKLASQILIDPVAFSVFVCTLGAFCVTSGV